MMSLTNHDSRGDISEDLFSTGPAPSSAGLSGPTSIILALKADGIPEKDESNKNGPQ